MASITIKGLTKTFAPGDDDAPAAVAGLDLDIKDNQFITLLGPSGCGKTTTLRMIAGYIMPDAGTIHVNGQLVSSPGNVTPPERAIIDQHKMAEIPLGEVATDPVAAAHKAAAWARKFERLLIHLDVDVLDYLAMPLAENTRRNIGLKFDQMMAALTTLLGAPNFAALTICEVNPDHGAADGATMELFAGALAESFAAARRVKLASRIAEG